MFGLLALLLFAAGCGKKTDPQPPEEVLPAPISDLAYTLDEGGVKLSWTVPRRTVQGARLPYRIKKFELWRAVVPAAEYRPEAPPPFASPLTVINEVGAGETMVFGETLLRPGYRYIYQVRSRAGWLLAGADSNRVEFTWLTPPTHPRELTATAADRRVELRWRPPAEIPEIDGRPAVVGYRVYRSADGRDFHLLGGTTEPLYVDEEVVGGRTYYYRVQAQAFPDQARRESRVSGPAGETVPVTARDLAPPPAPVLEAVLAVRDGVRLLWEMPRDRDLVEIVVQRRLAGDEEAREIARLAAPALSYIDRQPPPAADTWFYRLVSVDTLGNQSAAGNELRFDRP